MNLGRVFHRFHKGPRVLVIGLDCAAPELVFDRWRQDLPNLSGLVSNGISGELQSSIPAITVPAWSSMLSGRDPGEIGVYGFRNRKDYGYENQFIATSSYVKVPRIWDHLSRAGKKSVVIGVPQTYPLKELDGWMVSGFLAPGIENEFTFPGSLREEVLEVAPDYDVDVPQFRTDDKHGLLARIQSMTEKRFRVVDRLIKNKPWDFFMLMEIGVDRIHHGFWSYHDPLHRRYEPGNPFEMAIHDYYVFIDDAIGRWLSWMDDQTMVLVVSDHGAKRMDGGICINEWLRREGWLVLKDEPPAGQLTRFEDLHVDWPKTKAWGAGGYYARVFLNVEGREPEGAIRKEEYEAVREELAQRLASIQGPSGEDLDTKVFKPQEIYKDVQGIAPDLMVYFGDLLWRSVGTLGHEDVHTFENDTGPDDCNHAQNGLFILFDPRRSGRRRKVSGAQLMDVTPTLLDAFGLPRPVEVQGRLLQSLPAEVGMDNGEPVQNRQPHA